jgi:hypothetical protein
MVLVYPGRLVLVAAIIKAQAVIANMCKNVQKSSITF